MSVKPRKSAFSVYAENKPEPDTEIQSKMIDTTRVIKVNKNKKKNKKKNRKQNEPILKTMNNGNHYTGVSKPKNGIKDNKKAQMKFGKLPSEHINECIDMFGRSNPKHAFSTASTSVLKTNPVKKVTQLHSTPFPQFPKAQNSKMSKNLKQIIERQSDSESDELIAENTEVFDSRQEAINLFKKVIYPMKVKEFFSAYWEKMPMLVRREDPDYNKSWFSCKEFDKILRNHKLEFTTNIDVVTYVDEQKQTHNKEGRAFAPLVWDFFHQGCSIRLLNPSTYSRNCWKHLSTLQELFGTCVGANIYLTPAGTQGFAPHYDDIEAFVLQLEGKKRWRVYKPISKAEQLPRNSSMNFTQKEIGEPIIDCILEPGDLLYFPRGYIHQANACDDTHSLHITVSCYQKNSWADFLGKLLPGALEIASMEDIEYRKGLPINYLLNNGVAFDNEKITEDRKKFFDKTARLIKKLIDYVPIDAAVDQMGKQFIHDSLPPCLNESEQSRSIHGNGEKWNDQKMRVENIVEIEPDTAVKLVRRNCMRLAVEGDACFIYHNLENARIWHEKEPQYLEVESEAAPAIEFLINNYPNYCTVEELPLKTIEARIVVASCLYDVGLLVTGEPLDSGSGSEEDEFDEEEEGDSVEGSDDEEFIDEQNADQVVSIDNGDEFSDGDDGEEGSVDGSGDGFDSAEYDEDNEDDENDMQEVEDEDSDDDEAEEY